MSDQVLSWALSASALRGRALKSQRINRAEGQALRAIIAFCLRRGCVPDVGGGGGALRSVLGSDMVFSEPGGQWWLPAERVTRPGGMPFPQVERAFVKGRMLHSADTDRIGHIDMVSSRFLASAFPRSEKWVAAFLASVVFESRQRAKHGR